MGRVHRDVELGAALRETGAASAAGLSLLLGAGKSSRAGDGEGESDAMQDDRVDARNTVVVPAWAERE